MAMAIDELPTELIQYILSFLITPKLQTKEAARTIILSKNFLKAWSTFPDLYFSKAAFSNYLQIGPDNSYHIYQISIARERFVNCLLHTLTRYQQHNIPITTLHLDVCVADDEIANILEQSIRKVMENRVKEVYLRMVSIDRRCNLLQIIFSLRQLVSLKLFRCDLVERDLQVYDINCSSLRMLKLKRVTINEAVLDKLIQSCPLIEEIRIYYCQGFKSIKMSNLRNLKTLKVEFTVFNIESVVQNLKIIKLLSVDFMDDSFHSLIGNCPVLEELALQNCDGIEKINVSGYSLRLLSIIYCVSLLEVKIDSQILNMFEYHGNRVLSPLSFANGSCKSSVTISWYYLYEGSSFFELGEFLKTLKHTDNVSLVFETSEISFDKNIMDELRGEKKNIPEFEQVDLCVISPSSTYSTIMEGLMWSFSPKIISVKGDSKGFIKYLCTNDFWSWKNYFKQAKLIVINKDIDDDDDEWRPLHSLADVIENLVGDDYILKLSR